MATETEKKYRPELDVLKKIVEPIYSMPYAVYYVHVDYWIRHGHFIILSATPKNGFAGKWCPREFFNRTILHDIATALSSFCFSSNSARHAFEGERGTIVIDSHAILFGPRRGCIKQWRGEMAYLYDVDGTYYPLSTRAWNGACGHEGE